MTTAEFRSVCMEKFEAKAHYLNERARTNIEKYRKADHALRLLDSNGEPLRGVRVRVEQTSHDFKHGANIFMLDEFEEAEINARYRDTFSKYFNLATVPFYWSGTEPEEGHLRYDIGSSKLYRRPPADLCVDYCEEHGIMPKLHCLFYDKTCPEWMTTKSRDEAWRLYEKRFAEIAERYSGKMYEFEVTNELAASYNWKTCSCLTDEKDIGLKMWEMGRKYFPNETLVINDSYPKDVGIKKFYGPYYLCISELISKGASIDKIGVQSHVFCGTDGGTQDAGLLERLGHFDPELVIRGLDVLSEFGKPLEITEVTIPTLGEGEDAERLQADILRQLYTIWFATPRMESAIYWNLADGTAASLPGWDENNTRGGLFNYDMTPKAAALELKKLFFEEWHTSEELVTDENGFAKFRGFYGDYTASVGNSEFSFGIHKAHPTRTTRKIFEI